MFLPLLLIKQSIFISYAYHILIYSLFDCLYHWIIKQSILTFYVYYSSFDRFFVPFLLITNQFDFICVPVYLTLIYTTLMPPLLWQDYKNIFKINNPDLALVIQSEILTPTITVGQVWKPPNISQSNRVSQEVHQEIQPSRPIVSLIFLPNKVIIKRGQDSSTGNLLHQRFIGILKIKFFAILIERNH